MGFRLKTTVKASVVGLAAGLLAAALATGTHATAPDEEDQSGAAVQPVPERSQAVESRRVSFSVVNRHDTLLPCPADNQEYRVRGHLVGPERKLRGVTVDRLNILVHNLGAGAWFWNLRSHPAYDYAGQLARQGEVSLVLDRLGYDRSPLEDGRATCLGAQADMLHQVVQHARSGKYAADGGPLAASRVVLHGHSVGAALAQSVASTHVSDVDGLVLMSWAPEPSARAVEEAAQQTGTCLAGGSSSRPTFGPYGRTRADFRSFSFVTAPDAVQRAAAQRRNLDPCGDALGLSSLLGSTGLLSSRVDVPVLLLFGEKDALIRDGAAASQRRSLGPDAEVTTRTIAGAGNALPLERSAPRTRDHVLRWLRATY